MWTRFFIVLIISERKEKRKPLIKKGLLILRGWGGSGPEALRLYIYHKRGYKKILYSKPFMLSLRMKLA